MPNVSASSVPERSRAPAVTPEAPSLAAAADPEAIHLDVRGFAEEQAEWAWAEATDSNNPSYGRAFAVTGVIFTGGAVISERVGRGIVNVPYFFEQWAEGIAEGNPEKATLAAAHWVSGALVFVNPAWTLEGGELMATSNGSRAVVATEAQVRPRLDPGLKAEVAAEFAGVDSSVTVYHGGVLREGTVRAEVFSTTPELAHAQQYAAMRQGAVYRFNIPKAEFHTMLEQGQITRIEDVLEGTTIPSVEFRFRPSAAGTLNNFRATLE